MGNLGLLEPGPRLFREGSQIGAQIETGSVGRLDLLAIDDSDNLVVIELKAGRADDRAVGQLLRYMGWVKEHMAQTKGVRGILVANEFDDKASYTAKVLPNVALKRYEVRFAFLDG